MKLCQKLKKFSRFFSAVMKARSNFEDFEKKDEPHSWCISEIIDCQMRGYLHA